MQVLLTLRRVTLPCRLVVCCCISCLLQKTYLSESKYNLSVGRDCISNQLILDCQLEIELQMNVRRLALLAFTNAAIRDSQTQSRFDFFADISHRKNTSMHVVCSQTFGQKQTPC